MFFSWTQYFFNVLRNFSRKLPVTRSYADQVHVCAFCRCGDDMCTLAPKQRDVLFSVTYRTRFQFVVSSMGACVSSLLVRLMHFSRVRARSLLRFYYVFVWQESRSPMDRICRSTRRSSAHRFVTSATHKWPRSRSELSWGDIASISECYSSFFRCASLHKWRIFSGSS